MINPPIPLSPHLHLINQLKSELNNPDGSSNFKIMRKLAQSTFPVFLIFHEPSRQYLTMKVYPYFQGKPHPRFLNESRFSNLVHKNVNPIFWSEEDAKIISKGALKTSYIVMEYAPYETFFEAFVVNQIPFDRKLARTYFHQLIEGLEYIHSQKMAHLDLKLENLLVSDNFKLKIVDFDVSYKEGDTKIITTGTKNYRAPELIMKDLNNPQAIDVYSAGILLFIFYAGGSMPFMEEDEESMKKNNLKKLFYAEEDKFWKFQAKILKKSDDFFENDFRDLFRHMMNEDPSQRAKISEIKNSKWYNKPIYSEEEVIEIMERYY